MRIGYKTDVGKTRELDEDSIGIFHIDFINKSIKGEKFLLVVADGLGGHNAGEIASGLAVNKVAEEIIGSIMRKDHMNLTSGEIKDIIQKAVKRASRDIFKLAEKNPQYKGMGTTLTIALVIDSTVHIGHVGDSRAYIVNKNEILQITKDHSLTQELVDKGEITKEEARIHLLKDIITKAVGVYKEPEVDIYRAHIYRDDFLLLCSDGLTDMLSEEEIHATFMQNDDPKTICDVLVQKANDKGGQDNISMIVAQFDELAAREWYGNIMSRMLYFTIFN